MRKSKKYEPEKYNPRVPDILQSLSCEYQWLHLLKGMGKPYENLLTDLYTKFKEMDLTEVYDFSAKGLSGSFGIPTSQFSKWVRMIYQDLFLLNANEPNLFKTEGYKYNLHFEAFGNHASFSIWFSTPLSQHQALSFPFINAKVSFSRFYVQEIVHQHVDGVSSVLVFLSTDTPNVYRQFIHDKALFYNRIGILESFQTQYSLDERLKQLYPH